MRVFRISIGDDLVLVERSVHLAIVQQVFRQAADGIEIVPVELDGFFVGLNCVLVIFPLLVGSAQCGIEFGGTAGGGD